MKRLYRMEEGKKIAGICAGLADMYNLDPTIVRLAAVFLAIMTGGWPLVVTYAAGWYLIPLNEEVHPVVKESGE